MITFFLFFLLERKKKRGRKTVSGEDDHMLLPQSLCKKLSSALVFYYPTAHLLGTQKHEEPGVSAGLEELGWLLKHTGQSQTGV